MHSSSEEQIQRDTLTVIRRLMARYGYVPLSVPIVDEADLFLTKAGDPVITKLVTFNHYSLSLALRPEFTAAAARHYASQYSSGLPPGVVRWQMDGPVFVDSDGQSLHEMHQLSADAELIGSGSPAADAEIMALVSDIIATLNIDGWRINLGHVGLIRHLLHRYGLDQRTLQFLMRRRHLIVDGQLATLADQLRQYLNVGANQGDADDGAIMASVASPKGDEHVLLDVVLDATRRGVTMGGRKRQDIADRLIRKRQQAEQWERISQAIQFLARWYAVDGVWESANSAMRDLLEGTDTVAIAMLDDWARVIDLLGAYGVPQGHIYVQSDLVRDWDYYTGLVFEVRAANGDLLAGGGRYDELTRLISGEQDVPAVGFACDVTMLAAHANIPDGRETANVTVIAANIDDGIRWAARLRLGDLPVLLSLDTTPGQSAHVHVDADCSARYGERTYSLEMADELITDLTREVIKQ